MFYGISEGIMLGICCNYFLCLFLVLLIVVKCKIMVSQVLKGMVQVIDPSHSLAGFTCTLFVHSDSEFWVYSLHVMMSNSF